MSTHSVCFHPSPGAIYKGRFCTLPKRSCRSSPLGKRTSKAFPPPKGINSSTQFRRGLKKPVVRIYYGRWDISFKPNPPLKTRTFNGRRTIWRCISHLEWLWSIVMLVYWRVSPQINAKNLPIHEIQKCSDFVNPCLAPCFREYPHSRRIMFLDGYTSIYVRGSARICSNRENICPYLGSTLYPQL